MTVYMRQPYRWVMLIVGLGCLLSGLAYYHSLQREAARVEMQFDHLAHERALRLQGALNQTLMVLTSLRGLFDASDTVTRDEFGIMAAPILEHAPWIVALNWAPKVRHSERHAFEENLRQEGYAAQGIFDVSSNARVAHPAATRPNYYPVHFSEPLARNRTVIGIDPHARTENRAAMTAALQGDVQWSTDPFALVQDPQGERAVAIYQPVFRRSQPLRTPSERDAALRGFLILVLRTGALMNNTLDKPALAGLDKQLLNSDGRLIHHHGSRIAPATIAPEETLRRDYAIVVPGRLWSLRVSATQAFHQRAASLEAPITLGAGLLLTALLGVFHILLGRQNRRRAELAEHLAESETRFRQLAENIHAAFWIGTPDWRQVLYISPAYEHIWGRSSTSLLANGMDWADAMHVEDRAAVLEKLPGAGAFWQSIHFPPYRILRPDGEMRWISARAYPILNEQGEIVRVAGIAEDISEHQKQQRRLEELAHYDPLTHLPNRRLLADRMRQALAQGERHGRLLAICMLDLDGFKPVNDTHGHEVGDRLLVEVARRLQASVRGGDTVARLGGDEFVLLLGEIEGIKEVDEAMTRLLHVIAAPYMLVEQPIDLSASIGVTLYPDDTSDADTLLRHADHAMYLAKQTGKNRYHLFNPALEQRERENRAALQQIESAIEQDQFTLYYQPIIDCRAGKVVAMEALLRWRHPLYGLMSPAQFLPMLESDDRLARRMGNWVLRQALRQAQEWHRAGLNIPISVNTFAQQLRDPQFPEQIKALLAEHPELPGGCLNIEILESGALDDFAHVIQLIHSGSALGVRFALDDFGSSSSSLTYLRRLPVDILKIDQSFVRDMLLDPEDLTIVEGVVGLSMAFRHQVVAEGVESTEHVLMLMELGCHLVQGYGIAHPMPGEVCLDWLKAFQPDPRWLDTAALRLSRADFQLVLAEVNHRQWLARLRDWARHARDESPPPIAAEQCGFGHWYYGEGHQRYGHLPSFRALEALHARVHALAHDFVRHIEAGDIAGSLGSEGELATVSEDFREALINVRAEVKHPDLSE